MTAKQIEKEVQRQATLFEERCLKKPLPSRQRFFHGFYSEVDSGKSKSERTALNESAEIPPQIPITLCITRYP